jgi:murein DD-endopeptidase MepM/ murein hydrolase activator NlpD
MKNNVIIFILLIHGFGFGQESYPKDTFGSPLEIPLILAGTFGELRSNHFHAGIDIKTQQREGLPILSIGNGTVTRIKVSHWGYGKALYVAHPNGYTSVYGHLQKFSPNIEAYVKKMQYQKRSYEIELFPDFGELEVSQGEVIAYGGNTGGSSGPHLHFEIRSSISEMPTNPLLYGYDVADATNPILEKLFIYPLSENSLVNQSAEKVPLTFRRQADGTYLADKVTAKGTIGVGFVGFDRQDMAANKNGIYAVDLNVNGETYVSFDFERFSFGETRYINTLIDYDFFSKYRQRILKCFKSPGNYLSIYNELKNNGHIALKPGLSYTINLTISDLEKNQVVVTIPVEATDQELKIPRITKITENYIIAKKPNNFDLGGAKVYFPENTFYEDFYIDLEKGADTVKIHDNSVPAHRNFTITFDASNYSQKDQKQMFVARLDAKGTPNYNSTYKRGNIFTTRTRNLGTYTLSKDTIAPVIRTKNFKEKQWLNNYRYLSVFISDDLSGINTYSATLNGEWILMEYEPKRNTLTYNFDDKILDKKQCILEVTVTDNVGNTNTLKTTFYRN